MNIYISGGTAPTIDKYDSNVIYFVSNEVWLSVLSGDRQDDILIWQYQYPWNSTSKSHHLNLKCIDTWCKQQQMILDTIKKSNKKVFLFNEDCISLPAILKIVLNPTGNDDKIGITKKKESDIDELFFSLMSVWGKSYWNILERLDKSSLSHDGIKHIRKNKFSTNPKETLSSWLAFFSLTRQHNDENVDLKESISSRFDELAKLTIMLEEFRGKYLSEQQKNIDLTSTIDTNSAELTTLTNKLKEKDSKVADTQKKYETLQVKHKEAVTELTNKKLILEKNLKIANDEIYVYQEQIRKTQNDTANLEKEISQLRKVSESEKIQNAVLSADLELCKKSIDDRFTELAAITSMLEASKRQTMKLQEQLAAANEKNVAIKNSLSWKATAPIRALRNPVSMRKSKKNKKIQESIQLIKQSDLFDHQWYLAQNPDVRESGIDPARHYLLFGGFERRDPSANFSSQGYLDLHSDVKQSGINPLEHYLRHGEKEERAVVTK
ncbi:hypothetical protein [Aeromonas caviae]|uniref:hypothetical protein n=1 Tax=Aeromonas caviae TaxID=648 RepID=UPI0038D073FA